MIWFTSDLHFCHRHIIRYCNRPFSSCEHMREELIANWNHCVRPTDTVYVVGDFGFMGVSVGKEIVARLNGTKYIIVGNHDESMPRMIRMGFNGAHSLLCVEYGGYKFRLSHYPYRPGWWRRQWTRLQRWEWLKYNENPLPGQLGEDYLIAGHSHKKRKFFDPKRKQFNVGVDVCGFSPVSMDDVVQYIQKGFAVSCATKGES